MATQKHPKKYFYRSYRQDGMVRRDYLGTVADPVTRLLVRADEVTLATCNATANDVEAELAIYAQIEPCIRLISTECSRLVRQLRYRFRRLNRNVERNSEKEKEAMQTMIDRKLDRVGIDRDSFDELVDRATAGSVESLDDLKRVLRGNPGIYQVLGDLGRHVQVSMIDIAAADSVALRESLGLEMDDLRQELKQGGASALEKLLIEQVVATMLDVSIQQIGFAQPHKKESHKRRWERQLERAQKRHQAAVESLAKVRKVLRG